MWLVMIVTAQSKTKMPKSASQIDEMGMAIGTPQPLARFCPIISKLTFNVCICSKSNEIRIMKVKNLKKDNTMFEIKNENATPSSAENSSQDNQSNFQVIVFFSLG